MNIGNVHFSPSTAVQQSRGAFVAGGESLLFPPASPLGAAEGALRSLSAEQLDAQHLQLHSQFSTVV